MRYYSKKLPVSLLDENIVEQADFTDENGSRNFLVQLAYTRLIQSELNNRLNNIPDSLRMFIGCLQEKPGSAMRCAATLFPILQCLHTDSKECGKFGL